MGCKRYEHQTFVMQLKNKYKYSLMLAIISFLEPEDRQLKSPNENDPDTFGTLATNSPDYSVFSTLGADPGT